MTQIVVVLEMCLAKDTILRNQAHEQLKQLATSQDYINQLLNVIVHHTDVSLRQLSAVTLKNTITEIQWQNIGVSSKVSIRQQLLDLIGDPNKSIRNNIALTISKIAHLDYPEQWPTFFSELIQKIQSNNINTISGSMRVLSDFVRDDLTDLSFPQVAPRLMPELYHLFTNTQISMKIRSDAVTIIREFSDIIYMVKEEHPEVVQNYLDPMLNLWIPGFIIILQQPINESNIGLKTQVLKTVVKLCKAFPKETSNILLDLFNIVWLDICNLQTVYQTQYIYPSVDQYEDLELEGDSDGEVYSIETVLYSLLDFIQLLLKKKSMRENLKTGLDKIFTTLVAFLQITTGMEVLWSSDLNQFIQDDEQDSLSHNVRIAVEHCLSNLIDTFDEAPKVLLQTCVELFKVGINQKEGNLSYWWKLHECCFLALGRFPTEVLNVLQQGFNIDFVFTDILYHDIRAYQLPFLQGRALWFSSRFSAGLPLDLRIAYFENCVDSLQTTARVEVKIMAIKAICSFLTTVGKENTAKQQSKCLDGLIKLLPLAKDDVLVLVLETLLMIIGVDKEGLVSYEQAVSEGLLEIWNLNFQVMELLRDIFTEMSANPFISIPFQTRMYPVLLQACTPEILRQNPNVTATALDLLQSLIKHVSDPFPQIYTWQMYPKVMEILLTVDDSALLQNGQELLKTLVNRDFEGILNCGDESKNGLDVLMKFIEKMLLPSSSLESESAAIFIGKLINKLIEKGGLHISPYLPGLLKMVVERLGTAKMPSFVVTLVLIFCAIIGIYCDSVLAFLKTNGLELFLNKLCEVFHDLNGVYQVKLGATALIMLLSKNDPILKNIGVKGELIVDKTTKRIVTRSISKTQPDQYTIVPFPLKAIGLLLDEYQSQKESKMKNISKYQDLDVDESFETCSDNDENECFDFSDCEDAYSDLDETEVCNIDLCEEIKNCFQKLGKEESVTIYFGMLSRQHQDLVKEMFQ